MVVVIAELLRFMGYSVDPGLVVVFGTVLLLVTAWYFTIFKYDASWADLGLRSFRGSILGLGCGLKSRQRLVVDKIIIFLKKRRMKGSGVLKPL